MSKLLKYHDSFKQMPICLYLSIDTACEILVAKSPICPKCVYFLKN